MMNENQQQQQEESQALLFSESLRAANQAQEENAASANSNNNNGNFTIRINVGSNNNDNEQENNNSELRQRRTEATRQQVHARTIERLPGDSTNNQQTNTTFPVRHVHIQRSSGSTQRVRIVNNGGATAGNNNAQQRVRLMQRGQGIRVNPASRSARNQQVRIVANGGNGQQQQGSRVQLPPLQPQPLPYHRPHSDASTTDSTTSPSSGSNHEEGNEFKCLICFGTYRMKNYYACVLHILVHCDAHLILSLLSLYRIPTRPCIVWILCISFLLFLYSSCCSNGKQQHCCCQMSYMSL